MKVKKRLTAFVVLSACLAATCETQAQQKSTFSEIASVQTEMFADFENGAYDGWTLEGNCWLAEPASTQTFLDPRTKQSVVTGAVGKRFLVSFHRSPTETGKATSKEFTISKPFITFRIGGGHYPDQACLNLVIEGKVVRAATGNESNELVPANWNVSTLIGKKAHFEVVDTTMAVPRGYIMVDQIQFADNLPYRLVRHKTEAWHVEIACNHGAFDGTILFPVPPDDPGQEILVSRLVLEHGAERKIANVVSDRNALRQPVYQIEARETGNFRVVAEVGVQFYECALQFDDTAVPPKPLETAMRNIALNDEWRSEKERSWYRDWMSEAGLLRKKHETDMEYAFRILTFMQKNFTYKIPDELPEYKEVVRREGDFGSWKYRIATHSGECWRLSDIYARILRMNGVPVRVLSGNHIGKGSGHHLRTLVWLEAVGWIPVEPTAAVSNKSKPPFRSFGNWGGTMLNGNQNIGLSIPSNGSFFNVGTFDALWFVPRSGNSESYSEFVSTPLR